MGCDETDGTGEVKDTCEQVKGDESEATQASKMVCLRLDFFYLLEIILL